MVLYVTNFGNAGLHTTTNLPVLLAGGGGFQHCQHLAFDQTNSYPLSNLYGRTLQNLGIETDRFSSGAATMRGLEPAGS